MASARPVCHDCIADFGHNVRLCPLHEAAEQVARAAAECFQQMDVADKAGKSANDMKIAFASGSVFDELCDELVEGGFIALRWGRWESTFTKLEGGCS